MKPDKLDIKIQEAASHNDPAYLEGAWSAMEMLLDKEMPQTKKDNRKIFWLFLLLFLGTVTLLLINHPWGNTEGTSALPKEKVSIASTGTKDNVIINSANSIIKNIHKDAIPSSQLSLHERVNQSSFSKKIVKGNREQKRITEEATGNKEVFSYRLHDADENKSSLDPQIINPDKNSIAEPPVNSENTFKVATKDLSTAIVNNNTFESKKNSSSIKGNKNVPDKKIITPKRRNLFNNSFSLHFSAGPDISAVSMNNVGKINFAYGAGVSYQFSKRWAVRTGFYVERKVYDAKVSDYHPPARFWNYFPDLEYVGADCKVYEVPLIINYNFSQTSKKVWFASAGLSSFFMKKEDYHYFSKNPSGQNSYSSYSISNKNHHYFSSARLSAGYEKKLKNNISITAEPYLNIPFSGVGYGKVKLYNAGVLFTLNVKPFAKK